MIDYRVLVAAIAFLLVLLWRFRPQLSTEDPSPPVRGLEAAKTDAERVDILMAAGERYALRIGGARKASACFTRATRIAPEAVELVVRASRALKRHPRILETFLWRRLGAAPSSGWVGPEREVARAALAALVTVYDGASRTRPRARALEQVLAALDSTPAAPTAPTAPPPSADPTRPDPT